MKILMTTLLLTTLTVTAFANETSNFSIKKEKILSKITTRIAKVENRKNCMQNATSLEKMQSCRVKKYKNRPFKLKKGMTFEEKRTKVVNRITKRIVKINKRKACVENALDIRALKACKPQKKTKR